MADLYNLDAELEQGMMGTDDAHPINTPISTDEENLNNIYNTYDDPIEHNDIAAAAAADDDDDDDTTSDYQSMSNVPVALREAAMERQRIRHSGEKSHDNDNDDDDMGNDHRKRKDLWDTSKTGSYLFDSMQMQQQQEEKRNYQLQLENLPYTHLYRAWVQECRAPELLPYPYETIQQIRDGLLRYENYTCKNELEEDDRHRNRRHTNENLNALMDSLLRIDAERIKFLLSDLLKRRIQKITLHPQYYTQLLLDHPQPHEQEVDDDEGDEMNETGDKLNHHPLMCQPEITLLQNYMKIMKRHLSNTVTDHFPQEVWRTLDIPNDAVHEPNIQNQYVFIRCIDNVTIPDSTAMNEEDSEPMDHNDDSQPSYNFSQGGQMQQAGMCLIVRYARIRHLLLQGKVELV